MDPTGKTPPPWKRSSAIHLKSTQPLSAGTGWNQCNTDPARHGSISNWRYLVHAIKNPLTMSAAITQQMMTKGAMESQSHRTIIDWIRSNRSLSDIFRAKIKGKVKSCSLIDAEHPGMWSDQGVIIDLDSSEHVIATGTRDLGTHGWSLDAAKRQFSGSIIMSPEELMRHISGQYNEVVVSGEKPAGINVLGVVINVDAQGNPIDNFGAELMRKAQKERLPVIMLKPQVYGKKQNEVCIWRDEKATLISMASLPDGQTDVTTIRYYDEEEQVKYSLGLYLDETRGFCVSLRVLRAGSLDSYFETGPVGCFDFQSLKINYWQRERLQKAREVLKKIEREMAEIFNKNIVVRGGLPLKDLFPLLVQKLDDPASLVDCSWMNPPGR